MTDQLREALEWWENPPIRDSRLPNEIILVKAARAWLEFPTDVQVEAAAEAQADKIIEGYGLYRSPDYGGTLLERWEIVEMLKWSVRAALEAAHNE